MTSGPFANLIINLGPVSLELPGGTVAAPGSLGGLAYNPRCLRRDLTDAILRRYAHADAVLAAIRGSPDVATFQTAVQGVPGSGDIGIHGGGHYSLGGDPGRDFFTSSGDPAFYLHHGMMDRVWWMWQAQGGGRAAGPGAIAGTGTFLDQPPSEEVKIGDWVDLGWAPTEGPRGEGRRIVGDLLSTVAGPFCYVYV